MGNMKRLLLIMIGLSLALPMNAVRATNEVVSLIQPDGTPLNVLIHGDEWDNYLTTVDGEYLVQDSLGYYRVQDMKAYFENSRKNFTKREYAKHRILNEGGVPTTGTLRGLVLLVEFSDMTFSDRNDSNKFNRQLNEEGYSDDGATGSVKDYYTYQSGGLFTPCFDVVGPLKLDNECQYYGADINGVTDTNCYRMIEEACKLADEIGVDFSLYDNNSDGEVDLVYVIYCGYAQSNGASSNTIWPHMWYLSEDSVELLLDGVIIDRYACSSEKSGIQGDTVSGIGLFCHEFSHTLGLPDLYDVTSTSSKIMAGAWSVMDSGCYNNAMNTPAGYLAYEKSLLNWIAPIQLESPQKDVILPPLSEGTTYIIHSLSSENECYYFETRLNSDKWDAYIPAEGLIITYINYDKEIWSTNKVNAGDNWRVHLVPANGDFSKSSETSSIPFPGSKNKMYFTDITTPAMTFSDGNVVNLPISNILFNGNFVSFDIGFTLETPILKDPTIISSSSFKANWTDVEDADYYVLKITTESSGETKEYDKIFKNQYTLSGLNPTETYRYCVKAVNENLASDFSDERSINLKTLNIELINPDLSKSMIYSIDGIYLGSDMDSLSKGLYIIVNCDGTRKQIIK